MVDKVEVIYYELLKMEKRVTEKAQAVLDARDEVEAALRRFEALQKELIRKMEECDNGFPDGQQGF